MGNRQLACQPLFQELKLLIDSFKAQIFIVSEARIGRGSYPDEQCKLQGYQIDRRDRAIGGDGLIAYLRNYVVQVTETTKDL